MYRVKTIEVEEANDKRVERQSHTALKERSENENFIRARFKWNTLPLGESPFRDDTWGNEA